VDGILQRLILDGDALSDVMAPLELGWKARAQANTALIDLYWRIGQTLSHKVAQGGWGKGRRKTLNAVERTAVVPQPGDLLPLQDGGRA
jgi:hypothetical protein